MIPRREIQNTQTAETCASHKIPRTGKLTYKTIYFSKNTLIIIIDNIVQRDLHDYARKIRVEITYRC